MVIVAAWCVEDYQVICLAGFVNAKAVANWRDAKLTSRGRWVKFRIQCTPVCLERWTWIQRLSRSNALMKLLKLGRNRRDGCRSHRTRNARRAGPLPASLGSRVATLKALMPTFCTVRETLPLMPPDLSWC